MPNRFRFIPLMLLMWLHAAAQQEFRLPPYRQYTLRDGLSQMQVTAMMQDSRDFIWIGTKGGLNRFDGDKFFQYTSPKFPVIQNDYIQDIQEDSKGRIWASTNSGLFYTEATDPVYFDDLRLSAASLAADKKGNVWFISAIQTNSQMHLGYTDGEELVWFDHILPQVKYSDYFDIAYDEEDNAIIFSIDSFLYRYKDSQVEFIFKNNYPIVFLTGTRKNIYFVSYDRPDSLTLYRYRSGKVSLEAQVKDNHYVSRPGIKDSVLFMRQVAPYIPISLTPDSVLIGLNQGVHTSYVLQDKEGTVWIGAEDGLYQLYDNGLTAYSQDYLPQIWAVTEDRSNNLWFTSYLYGIFRLKDGRLDHFTKDHNNNLYAPYFHPAVDRRGRIFFPHNHGLLMVDGDRFEEKQDGLYLTCFYDAERDLLWGGSRRQAIAFDPDRKEIRKVGEAAGLDVGSNVLTIKKDNDGLYWFGGGRGVARYNWDTGKLKNYRAGGKINGIVTSCMDHTGRMWFGAKQGLFWYNPEADSLIQLNRDELTDAVNMVACIDSTWLLASQPHGIYLIDLQEYYKTGNITLHLFNEKNGLTGIEPGQDGAFIDSRGIVWLTTSTSLVSIDPRKLNTGKYHLSVMLEKINGLWVPFTTERIEPPPNQNSLIVTFGTVSFNRPNPVEYSWKVGNGSWSDWQEDNYAVLSGLKDGRSELSVRARIRGLPLEQPALAEFPLFVSLAVYRQPWFWPVIFLFLTFAGIISLILVLMKMKKISREATVYQVQAIQSQMNPHFIFNVLAFLQARILKNNLEQANDHLVRMAGLIRGFLEASVVTGRIIHPKNPEGQITLAQELKMIEEFVHFQSMIFPDKFEYELHVQNVECEKEYIPPMLLQPFVENAIRHGLLPLKTKGKLTINISKTGDTRTIEIKDNGKGMRQADALVINSALRYVSRGRELTIRRIELLNKMGFRISMNTDSQDSGTTVTLKIQ
jgi:ligand-binding sensor domain-containing protein